MSLIHLFNPRCRVFASQAMVSRGAVLVLLVALVASVYAGRETLKVRACDTPTATRVIAKQTILIGLYSYRCMLCVCVCHCATRHPSRVAFVERITGRVAAAASHRAGQQHHGVSVPSLLIDAVRVAGSAHLHQSYVSASFTSRHDR